MSATHRQAPQCAPGYRGARRVIFGDNMEAGLRFPEACDATFERLVEVPFIGSARRFKDSALSGARWWPVLGFPNHLVFYLVRDDGIEIIRVLHGAQDLERILGREQ